MKTTGKILDTSLDYKTGKLRIAVALDIRVPPEDLDDLIAKDIVAVEIKDYHPKRSLDANAYCWVLLGKLNAKLGIPTTELYREAIRDVGDNYDVVCCKNDALDRLVHNWEHNGLGWIAETFDSKIPDCHNVRLFYGSSVYDSAQMSRLIDIICRECKTQGIQTDTPEEIARMVEQW